MSLLQTGTGRVDCKKCNLLEIVLFYMSYQIVEHGAKAKNRDPLINILVNFEGIVLYYDILICNFLNR